MFSEFLLSKEDIDQFCRIEIQQSRKVGFISFVWNLLLSFSHSSYSVCLVLS